MKDLYDLAHAKSRLERTIVRLGEDPIEIVQVEAGAKGRFKLVYRRLGEKKDTHLLYWPHKNLNLTPVPLGLINVTKGAVLKACRGPSRQWKIGLSENTLHITKLMATLGHDAVAANYNKRSLFNSHDLANTILNKYPDYDQAYNRVDKRELGTAFSRSFACGIEGNLLHSVSGIVGAITKAGPKLNDDYFYLQQSLDGVMG